MLTQTCWVLVCPAQGVCKLQDVKTYQAKAAVLCKVSMCRAKGEHWFDHNKVQLHLLLKASPAALHLLPRPAMTCGYIWTLTSLQFRHFMLQVKRNTSCWTILVPEPCDVLLWPRHTMQVKMERVQIFQCCFGKQHLRIDVNSGLAHMLRKFLQLWLPATFQPSAMQWKESYSPYLGRVLSNGQQTLCNMAVKCQSCQSRNKSRNTVSHNPDYLARPKNVINGIASEQVIED